MPSQPNRKKGANSVTKHDRDTSKKNVALSKARQHRDKAVKSFAQRQKDISTSLAEIKKIKSVIDDLIKKRSAETKLEATFLNQILGKVKALKNLEKQIKTDQASFAQYVDTPKTYTMVAAQVKKLPAPSKVQTFGDLSVMLAVVIVLLNRMAALKISKEK